MRFKLPRASHLFALLALATAAAVVAAPGAVGSGAAGPLVATDASTDRTPLTLGGGPVNVVVTLTQPSVAIAAEQQDLNVRQQRSYASRLEAQQAVVSKRIKAVGGRELARVTAALNAIVLRIDASKINRLKRLKGVARVRPINDYELDLSETVPYIGAAAAQAGGVDGTGIDIAIIDSGIDYTHQAFGGPGTAAAYQAAYGTQVTDTRNTTLDGLFPTAKVVGGFDFVGEFWPGLKPGSSAPAVLHPDPDPIDCGPAVIPPSPDPAPPAPPVPNCAGGHGSHVADITAGVGPNKGVAPGAKLYAYKACSATSTSCSGVAMLQSINAALDPNGDGSIADRVDVMNLSIGSSYGQVEDDISLAFTNASRAGIVVVASAGNSADRPYITSSGSTSPDAISVAQTQVPSAKLSKLVAGAVTVGALHQPWSAAPTLVSGPLAYDTTSAATRIGCTNAAGDNPFTPGSHAGKVLLMDRGTCAISAKVFNANIAGAVVAIVANNVSQGPGDLPPVFSFGGPGLPPSPISGYTTTLAAGNQLKTVLGTTASIDPADTFPLVGHMVSSSSRGPSHSFVAIKPDIGAPGASVSAEAGTGTGGTAFGGTSGAAPMVTGSAALLLDKNGSLSVGEVKSLLMNTAETNVFMNPSVTPNPLAPITRIGGGEVRVDKALASGTAAWAGTDVGAALSFGYHAVDSKKILHQKVTVKNYTGSGRWYTLTETFRYADDAASGAVEVDARPSRIFVPAGKTRTVDVKVSIDPSKLPVWASSGLAGGPTGGDGFRLESIEFDGYISIDGGPNNTVHVAWHVLPHRAADIDVDDSVRLDKNGTASTEVENDSKVLDGRYDMFALTGTSPRSATPIPGAGDNFALVDLKAVGVRQVGTNVQFGIDTFGSRSHPNYPAEFDILVDNNRDGRIDRILFTAENGGFAATGTNVTFVFTCTAAPPADSCSTGTTAAFFFTDAELNSGNAIMAAPLSALGLTATTKFDFSVEAYDNYFTGILTDSIGTMTHTLATPKFTGSGLPAVIPAKGKAKLNVASVPGGDLASPSQTGFLLLYRDAEGVTRFNSRNEADTIEVEVKKKKKKKHDDDD
jgi:subtilisin family serine protease